MPNVFRTTSQDEFHRVRLEIAHETSVVEFLSPDSFERDDFFRAALRYLPMGDATEHQGEFLTGPHFSTTSHL